MKKVRSTRVSPRTGVSHRAIRFANIRVSATAAMTAALVFATGCADAPPPPDDGPTFPDTNRPDVRGTTGAVSSGHPLATAAGMDVLHRGGNAMDAAIAMAGVLAVVRPHMNGVGGDAFGLVYEAETGIVHALNGSGRSGSRATPDFFSEAGHDEVPEVGPMSVSVPGAVSAWETALQRFGTWSLRDVLSPAVHYARDGFPVSTRLASDFAAQGQALNEAGKALYLPGGTPPEVGSLLKNPALAATLERVAAQGSAGFYSGFVAERLVSFLDSAGGTLTREDLASHQSDWVEPIVQEALGYRIHAMPPNTQGMAQLAYAAMAGHHDLSSLGHNSPDYLHTMIELKKLAFADRNAWASDPEFTPIPLDRLLDGAYLAERATSFSDQAAGQVLPGIESTPPTPDGPLPDDTGDTVYLTVVDQWGNGVSWIQSLFHGFGSGLLEAETGVVLHNRGSLYTLAEGHPNIVAPRKRPYHTLSPLLALNLDGSLGFTLGTPGGDSQPQSLLQIMNNLILFGMTPQAAIEAPRFRSYPGLAVDVEDRMAEEVRQDLASRGHEVRVVHGWTAVFGGAQMILVDHSMGTLTVASDPRREAYGLAY